MELSPVKTDKYPSGIPYIVGNEAAERFSFYGMKAILAFYLVSGFHLTESEANENTHLFISLAYFLPVIGALVADWFWGKYKTILYLSVVYCLGHLCLAIYDIQLDGFMFGLLLIAIGSGGIKPCVSANVGDQFNESNSHLLDKVFGWFYFSINFGSIFSTLLTPYLLEHYGPAWAFGVPGIFMGIATVIFWLGRNKYIRVPPTGMNRNNFLFINFYALIRFYKKKRGQSLLDVAKESFNSTSVDNVKAVWSILSIFVFYIIFWALYDQNSSEWVLQAAKMDLDVFGFTIHPAMVQAINPALILIFVPVFTYWLFPWLEKKKINFSPLRKIGTGFFIASLSFVIVALIQERIDVGLKPGVEWQLLAFFVLTIAEIFIYLTGLQFAYTQAPPAMKSTIMSLYLLTISIGNYLVSLINANKAEKGFFTALQGADYYWFFFGMMLFSALLFIFVARKYKVKNYLLSNG